MVAGGRKKTAAILAAWKPEPGLVFVLDCGDEADVCEYFPPDFALSKASLPIKLFPAESTIKVQQVSSQIKEPQIPRTGLSIHTKTS